MIVTFFRAFILYALIVVVMRVMGKRQLGQLQPSELVLAILIAELVAVPMEDISVPLLAGIVPVATLFSAEIILSFLSLKSEKIRSIVSGKPTIVIRHGKIIETELRKSRVNMNDLLEQLRMKDFANIADVEFAILETGGQLSVIPTAKKKPVTAKDLGLAVSQEKLPVTIILDGKLNAHNLTVVQLDKSTLLKNLHALGIHDVKDVFFASIESDGSLFVQRKQEKNR